MLTMAVGDNRPEQLQTYRSSWKERPAHVEQRLITMMIVMMVIVRVTGIKCLFCD